MNSEENIYEEIKEELMIFLDDIIFNHINKKKKHVRFNNIVRVCIIPNLDFYKGEDFLYADIWWKQTEIVCFRQIETMNFYKFVKENPNSNMKDFNDNFMAKIESGMIV